jgi:hypothetical protein
MSNSRVSGRHLAPSTGAREDPLIYLNAWLSNQTQTPDENSVGDYLPSDVQE